MTYVWYYIFNMTEDFPATLVSRTFTVILNGIGQKEILVTRGNLTGITYEGVFLPLNLNSKNPFEFEDLAVHIDEDDNVRLGIAVEEE